MRCPNTPFATHFSGSEKETKLRICSIVQWEKRKPPLWILAVVTVFVLGCGSLVGFVSGLRYEELGPIRLESEGYVDARELAEPYPSPEQFVVFLEPDPEGIPQTAIRFRKHVLNALRAYRYQRVTDFSDRSAPRYGNQLTFAEDGTLYRLYWDGWLWVPTDEGWAAYVPNNTKGFKQDMLELHMEYHNSVIPILQETIWREDASGEI